LNRILGSAAKDTAKNNCFKMSVIPRLDRAIQYPLEWSWKKYQRQWLLDAPLEASHDMLSIHLFSAVP